ncbi:secretin N-terminal domain-containing protein [Sulfurirhabdus autotrophica]|uniref:General secretion pathway protein D n=1 Tax=Sulfurirhabdus autotrophica TaxID=1706046 RepID=A0A4R3YGF9_9PROT|nr:secretin N-terminal domain-containing protein [Sulfurirhabdus autotrophica]TCV89643.1 general secretion pathway protein D [Sulfurirhabdus autotrophica]
MKLNVCNRCWLVLSLITLLISGCAGEKAFRDGKSLLAESKIEEGLAQLETATKEDPKNIEYRAYLHRERLNQVNRLLLQADSLRTAGQYDEAEKMFTRVQKIDKENKRAADGLQQLQNDRKHNVEFNKANEQFTAGNIDASQSIVRAILAEDPSHLPSLKLQRAIDDQQKQSVISNPPLASGLKKPITLEFRDANMRSVFEVISRTSGINFIFDKDVRPDLKATVYVKNSSIENVINLLLITNQLEKRILSENTLLIYPNTPAKAKDYQELVVKSFYLANADVKQTLNMIKTMLKTRDVFIDEKLNLLMMRDTPEVIRLAEKLITAQDMAEPEVMLEVEVLEVKRSKLTELGIQYPNQFTVLNLTNSNTVTTSAGSIVATTPSVVASQLTVESLKTLNAGKIGISSPVLNLRKEDSDTNILANPRIRVKNREKAKIHIGDKVPVITTTSTANVGISESVSYLDIGLKLDVEPNIFLENEVGIKVGLEVSNIVREIKSSTGTLTYQVGTRNAVTNLRLKDGETQALAGLINDEDRASASKIPGLGDLPLFGHLFSSHRDEHSKTEIILLITPHIVRNLVRPDSDITEFTSGTETSIGAAPLFLGTATPKTDKAPSGQPVISLSSPPKGVSTTNPAANQATTGIPVQLGLIAPPQANIGKEFVVNVSAAAFNNVKQTSFEVVYDPAKLEVTKVQAGNFLEQDGQPTDFTHTGEGSGYLRLNFDREAPVNGSGNLAIIYMRPLPGKTGPTSLSISNPEVADMTGNPVKSSATPPRPLMIVP